MNAHLMQTTWQPSRLQRVVLALAMVAGIVLAPFMAASPARADDVTSTEKAIVQLYQQYTATFHYKYSNGKSSEKYTVKVGSSCTGLFVDAKGAILTASHCVNPDSVTTVMVQNRVYNVLLQQGYDRATAEAYALAVVVNKVSLDGVVAYQPKEVGGVLDSQGFQVQVVAFTAVGQDDHALLRLNNFSQETPYLTIADVAPAIHEHITAIGFPGVATDVSDVGRQRVSYPDGKVTGNTTVAGVPFKEVSVDLKHGMSGGPVVNDANQVVGLVSWGYSSGGDEVKYMTDLDSLRRFLTTNGVQLQAAPVPQMSASEDPLPAPVEPTTPAPASDQGSLVWVVWALVGVIVVGGAVVAVVVVRGRSKAVTQGNPPQAVAPTQQLPTQGNDTPPQE